MIDLTALFKVSYGMYVVSSGTEGKANGFISNSVFQVTAEPPQFAACCNKENFTAKLIQETGAYSISVLKQDASTSTIGTFGYKSGRDIDKLEKASHINGELGIPVVTEDAIAYMECKLINTFDVGTHLIFIGEVIHSKVLDDSPPLTYAHYRETRNGVAPKNAPTYIDKKKLKAEPQTNLDKYRCVICGHIYDPEVGDPESGIKAGTKFEDLPDDWACPICGATKEDFEKI